MEMVGGVAGPETFTGRAITNNFTAAWHGREDRLQRELAAVGDRYARAAGQGDLSLAVVWAGEGLDLIGSVEPAAAIIERMMREAKGAIDFARSAIFGEPPTGPG